ncbi:hypothetical protein ACFZBU_43575 [Embleya sp. NPDC008237]|uniref:hypothetical protein n=1 Tax=Embleya sp. NPDC008237 TaxID=3363978 RepID=UPI0036ED8C0E
MLSQELTALVDAGGTAVVDTAGTEAWPVLRGRIAAWVGRGDRRVVERTEQALGETAARLARAGEAGDTGAIRSVRDEAATAWRERLAAVLADLADTERTAAADELATVLGTAGNPSTGGVGAPSPADSRGLAVGGDLTISARDRSAAAAIVQGDVTLRVPTKPVPATRG